MALGEEMVKKLTYFSVADSAQCRAIFITPLRKATLFSKENNVFMLWLC